MSLLEHAQNLSNQIDLLRKNMKYKLGILLSLSSGGDQTIKYLGERKRGVRVKR